MSSYFLSATSVIISLFGIALSLNAYSESFSSKVEITFSGFFLVVLFQSLALHHLSISVFVKLKDLLIEGCGHLIHLNCQG
jgi:hypothetical protein